MHLYAKGKDLGGKILKTFELIALEKNIFPGIHEIFKGEKFAYFCIF